MSFPSFNFRRFGAMVMKEFIPIAPKRFKLKEGKLMANLRVEQASGL